MRLYDRNDPHGINHGVLQHLGAERLDNGVVLEAAQLGVAAAVCLEGGDLLLLTKHRRTSVDGRLQALKETLWIEGLLQGLHFVGLGFDRLCELPLLVGLMGFPQLLLMGFRLIRVPVSSRLLDLRRRRPQVRGECSSGLVHAPLG